MKKLWHLLSGWPVYFDIDIQEDTTSNRMFVTGWNADSDRQLSVPFNDTNWHCWIYTYAGIGISNNINLYKDGELVATGTFDFRSANSSNGKFVIGGEQGGYSGADASHAKFANIRFWNYVINSEQISQEANRYII